MVRFAAEMAAALLLMVACMSQIASRGGLARRIVLGLFAFGLSTSVTCHAVDVLERVARKAGG